MEGEDGLPSTALFQGAAEGLPAVYSIQLTAQAFASRSARAMGHPSIQRLDESTTLTNKYSLTIA